MDGKHLPEQQTGGTTNLSTGGSDCPFKSPYIEKVEVVMRGYSVEVKPFDRDLPLYTNRFDASLGLKVQTKNPPSSALYVKVEHQPLMLEPPWVKNFRPPSDLQKQLVLGSTNAAADSFKLGTVSGDRYRFCISFQKDFPDSEQTIITPFITIKRRFAYTLSCMKRAGSSSRAPFGRDFDFDRLAKVLDQECFIELEKVNERELPHALNVTPSTHENPKYGVWDVAADFHISCVSRLYTRFKRTKDAESEAVGIYSITTKAVDIALNPDDVKLAETCDPNQPLLRVKLIPDGETDFSESEDFKNAQLIFDGNGGCRLQLTIDDSFTVAADNFVPIFRTLQSCKGAVPVKRNVLLLAIGTIEDSCGQGDPTDKTLSTAKHELCHMMGLVPSRLPDGSKNQLHIRQGGDHCIADPPCLMHQEDPDATQLCATCRAVLMVRRLKKLPPDNFNDYGD